MVDFCSYSHRNWVLSSMQWRVNSQHNQVYTISKYRSIIITYPLALMLFNQPLNLDVFLLLCSQKQLILIDNQNYYYTKRFHLACDNDIYEARRHNKDEYGRHLKLNVLIQTMIQKATNPYPLVDGLVFNGGLSYWSPKQPKSYFLFKQSNKNTPPSSGIKKTTRNNLYLLFIKEKAPLFMISKPPI